MKTITLNPFDPVSIDDAIAKVNAYKKSLKDKCIEMIDIMCRTGEKYAVTRWSAHVDTGLTENSVLGYRNGKVGIIAVGGNAVWIEFGTGTVSGTYSGTIPPDLTFPKGWVYPGKGHGKDTKGWYYYDEIRQKVFHTFGQPSDPIMWETARKLEAQAEKFAKAAFGNEV